MFFVHLLEEGFDGGRWQPKCFHAILIGREITLVYVAIVLPEMIEELIWCNEGVEGGGIT